MIADVDRERMLKALEWFDRDLRQNMEWIGWEERENYKYAIEYDGKRYPVKQIINGATGTPLSDFNGGTESNEYVAKRGFAVVLLRGGGDSIQANFERVLQEYQEARQSPFTTRAPVCAILRTLARQFEQCDAVSARQTLKVEWSAGQGNWAKVPWISFLDSRETDSVQRGVYCVYLFREDMTGVYATFNQGVTAPSREKGVTEGRKFVRQRAEALRGPAQALADHGFSLDDQIDLRSKGGLGSDYEHSTVAYKLYEASMVPGDEQILSDLDAMLVAYDQYLVGASPPLSSDFLSVMARYHRDGVVFQSAARGIRYFIQSVDQSGCEVQRVGDGGVEHCPVAAYDNALARVRGAGGQLPRKELHASGPIRVTVRQGPGLALTADKQFAIDIADTQRARASFAELLANLRVDQSDGFERPYKAVMLLCALEAIERGEVTENRIRFDDVLPWYLRKLESLGIAGDDQKAALPFFHLTGDLFWMLCYEDPAHPLDSASPAAIRERVKYATLKDPYWTVLADASARRQLMQELKERWNLGPAIPLSVAAVRSAASERGLKLPDSVYAQLLGALESGKHVILTGPPGTGKTTLAEVVAETAQRAARCRGSVLTTATADWTTYETIGGLRPNQRGELEFEEGHFLAAIRNNQWLIIDELNRSHFDRAFGQLFTVLSGQTVHLPYRRPGQEHRLALVPEGRNHVRLEADVLTIPDTWRILATMNVFDKSLLFEMSFAMMRRFAFVEVPSPDEAVFEVLIQDAAAGDTTAAALAGRFLALRELKDLGPAVFLDLARFLQKRRQLQEVDDERLAFEGFYSYLLPQFEGIELDAGRTLFQMVSQVVGPSRWRALHDTLNAVLGLELPLKAESANDEDGSAFGE